MSNVPARIPQINSVELSELVIKYDGAIVAIQDDYKTLMNEVALAKSNGGITSELDLKMNNMLVSMKLTVEKIYNGRLEYTKPMDEIKEIFTNLEALISPKQTDAKHRLHTTGMYATITRERDEYARVLKAAKDKADRENEARINKGKEYAMLKANCESIIRTSAEESIAMFKRKANEILETATLDTVDGVEDTVASLDLTLFNEAVVKTNLRGQARLHTPEEVESIFKEVYTLALQSDLAQNSHSKVNDYCDYIKKSVPGKKVELEKIAAASEEQAAALKKQADERAAQSQASINFESNQATQNIASEVAAKEQAAVAEVLFAADIPAEAQKGVRTNVAITITNVRAVPQIMAMYHRIKGVTLTPEEYLNVKVGSMVKVCEKNYQDTGEKIESSDLIYGENIKTSARK